MAAGASWLAITASNQTTTLDNAPIQTAARLRLGLQPREPLPDHCHLCNRPLTEEKGPLMRLDS